MHTVHKFLTIILVTIYFLSGCSRLNQLAFSKSKQDIEKSNEAVILRAQAEAERVKNQRLIDEKDEQEKNAVFEREHSWASLSEHEVKELAIKNHVEPFRVYLTHKNPIFVGVYLDSINNYTNIYGRPMTAGVIVYTPSPETELVDPKFSSLSGLKVTAKKGMYMSVDCANGWAETSITRFAPIQKFNIMTGGYTDQFIAASIICMHR